ncbi:MAG: hemolysin family protein [Caldiserica bacterium]|nr:hemolysin family protein [Caldisericota bacterium]
MSLTNLSFLIPLLVVLLALSAIFSAFESAIFNASYIKLESLSKKSNLAKKILSLKKRTDSVISTIVLGNNFVNILFSAIITYLAIKIAESKNVSQSLAVIVATIIATLVIVLFGETVPKSIGAYLSEKSSMKLYYPFMLFWFLFYPLALALSHITNGFLKLFHIKKRGKRIFDTQEEMLSMLEIGKEEGIIEKTEQKMIFSIFEFGDTLVREVMTPRVDIISLSVESTLDDVLKCIMNSNHSRIPIYENNIDNIIGILYIKDLFKIFSAKTEKTTGLQSILRNAYFVPETKGVDELFNEMQKNKIQIAMVFDEYGGLSGLITIEDILEEIVGEIQDEYEVEEKTSQKIGENAYLISGTLEVEDFNEHFNANFSDEEATTIGGIILEKLGRLPNPGEEISINKFKFIISKIRNRRIVQVKVIVKSGEEKNEKRAH